MTPGLEAVTWGAARLQAKGEADLDHYQVRSWRAWYAHITLSALALAWLAASGTQAQKGGDRHQRPRHDRLHVTRDPQAPHQPDPAERTRSPGRLVLVPLAPKTPVPGPAVSLQAPRLCTRISDHQASGIDISRPVPESWCDLLNGGLSGMHEHLWLSWPTSGMSEMHSHQQVCGDVLADGSRSVTGIYPRWNKFRRPILAPMSSAVTG